MKTTILHPHQNEKIAGLLREMGSANFLDEKASETACFESEKNTRNLLRPTAREAGGSWLTNLRTFDINKSSSTVSDDVFDSKNIAEMCKDTEISLQ